MARLDGKVAIITGSAQGMGESHARMFINEGAKVVITDLNEEKGSALAEELGENAIFVKQNVTSEENWKYVIEETEETGGPVDVIVKNAGTTMSKPSEETTLDGYNKMVQINQISVFLGIKAVGPSMK